MEKQEAQKRLEALREQIRYHSRKYYTEDDPEISDFEYDQLYRQLETLEAEFPGLVTEDSPTRKIGGAVYNTFAPVTHLVPLESLHDSFSQEELRDFDRRVRDAVGEVEYVVEPKFDGLSVALEYRDGVFVREMCIRDRRLVGYDYVLSIEHEDSLMSKNEGLVKACDVLKRAITFEDKMTTMRWI